MKIKDLFESQQFLLDEFQRTSFYERHSFEAITCDNRITGIMGPRGIGKTSFLLHKVLEEGANEKKALYLSADSYYLLETPLIELVGELYKQTDIRLLCIDEIQKYANWNQELKNIFDTYRNLKVLFTGSSMIDLIKAKYDLSRRVTMHTLHGFSFREYLAFTQKIEFPVLTLDEVVNNHEKITAEMKSPKMLMFFNEYLRQGYYPFFTEFELEQEKFQAIENATQKTIYEDIATLHALKTPTLLIIEKIYKYVVASLPGEISAYKLASTLSKDYESVCTYLYILEQAGLIRNFHIDKTGKAMLKVPAKFYPENTNLIFSARLPQLTKESKGKIRETFAMNQFENSGHPVFYTKQGDFSVNDYTFEVGGQNKTRAQIKDKARSYILSDGIVHGLKDKIPLYLLGFLY